MNMNKKYEKPALELLHYVLVFAVIAGTWTTIMDYFAGSIFPTLGVSFVLFVIADKIAHKYLMGE